MQVAKDAVAAPASAAGAAMPSWSSGIAAYVPSTAQHSPAGIQSTAVESSPFSQPIVQNFEPSQPKAITGAAGSEHAGDSLGAPKASGDVWDNNRPLTSPFTSMQSGPTFDQSGLAASRPDDALGQEEPHRFSTEDIATLTSGTRLQGAGVPSHNDSGAKPGPADGGTAGSLHTSTADLSHMPADSLLQQGHTVPQPTASLI